MRQSNMHATPWPRMGVGMSRCMECLEFICECDDERCDRERGQREPTGNIIRDEAYAREQEKREPDEPCVICGKGVAEDTGGQMECPVCNEPYYTHKQLAEREAGREPGEVERAHVVGCDCACEAGAPYECSCYQRGQREERERAAKVAENESNFSVDPCRARHVCERIAAAIREGEK